MSLHRSLLGSRHGSAKEVSAPAAGSLPPEALATGGMLLTAAGLALIGPLAAALLIRSRGAVGTDAATTPLVLAALAVVLAVAAGVALFVSAWRRAHSRAPLPATDSLSSRGPGGAL
ncbi:hypothetical protein AB0L57_01745 [Nocardia sp. NPDC052254]|uniref:hypothetical protein n=1 Tax=Nocardia sp. NPDC052254 TaxID=3155681 RepID=UPI0034233824